MKKQIPLFLLLILIANIIFTKNAENKEILKNNYFKNDALGIEWRFPEGIWTFENESQGFVKCFTFQYDKDKELNVALIAIPSKFGIKTAKDREFMLKKVFKNNFITKLIKKSNINNRKSEMLIYEIKLDKQVYIFTAHILVLNEQTFILQIQYPKNKWNKNKLLFHKIYSGINFFNPTDKIKTKHIEIKINSANKLTQNAVIKHHTLFLSVNPNKGELHCKDDFSVTITKNNTKNIEFIISDINIKSIKYKNKPLKFYLKPYKTETFILNIRLPVVKQNGDTLNITFSSERLKYIYSYDTNQIPYYNIFGQINKISSFSTHICYYPIDENNTATGDMYISVPSKFTAIGVGRLIDIKSVNKRKIYHWKTNISIPRILPFSFAVGEYNKLSAKSKSGTEIEIYSWKKYDKYAKQRLELTKKAVDFFSNLYGKFPFEKISIIHVKPLKGLIGASLPTMIFLSDEFFIKNIDFNSLKKESSFDNSGLLVLIDEISHQWNTYGISFPNEISEGMAQYAESLFAEHFIGKEVLMKHMNYYMKQYKNSIKKYPDYPINSPEIYNTKAYMDIAFCKGAVILNMLRYIVGDMVFFKAHRILYKKYFGKKATIKDLQNIIENLYNKPMEWFFDQWYNRKGYPIYKIKIKVIKKIGNKYLIKTLISQLQNGKPYKMPIDIRFYNKEEKIDFNKVWVDKKEFEKTFLLSFIPKNVELDNKNYILKEIKK